MTPLDRIRPDVRALTGYHVQPSNGLIKLDAMENPFGLPVELRARLGARLAEAAFNRYPDPDPSRLKTLLARAMGVPDGAALVLGNGSDEIIQMLAQAVAVPGASVLGVEPSFVMFRLLAGACGLAYHGVPLKTDFSLDLDAVLAAIALHRPALIFLANPNNPTGNLFSAQAMEVIVRAATGIVVVDEAYFPFTDTSWLARLPEFPQLVVMRTVSKLGLAGIRLGLLAGQRDLLAEIDKLRLPYNLSVATQIIAETVLESVDVLHAQTRLLRSERGRLAAALAQRGDLECFASEANFLLIRVAEADRVFDALRLHGILIKNLNHAHGLLRGCLRITVGTPQENDRFLDALDASLRLPR